jgi:hypothetical protein
VITLKKGDKGLGFSILDYQDPLNMSETVIVVRSLVPGGIAQLDGQIVPGDRILHVNQVRLEHVSLDTAVQALKGKVPSLLGKAWVATVFWVARTHLARPDLGAHAHVCAPPI